MNHMGMHMHFNMHVYLYGYGRGLGILILTQQMREQFLRRFCLSFGRYQSQYHPRCTPPHKTQFSNKQGSQLKRTSLYYTYLSHHIVQSGTKLINSPSLLLPTLTSHSLFHSHPPQISIRHGPLASIPAIKVCVILYYASCYFFPWSFACRTIVHPHGIQC